MFKSSFRGTALPLALAGASLSLILAGCGGGSGTNLPTPGSGNGVLGTGNGGTGGGGGTGAGGGGNLANNAIVFVSTRDGNPEIYSVNANGSNLRRLTTNSTIDERPSRSRDGSSIVFSSQRDGNSEIYKMNADGSNVVRLTNDANAANAPLDTSPVFSPDGNKIVWQSTRAITAGGGAVRRLYTMDSSGANQTPVVFDDQNQPSFDGSWANNNTQLFGFLVNPNDNSLNDLAFISPGFGTTTPATANTLITGSRSAHARSSPDGTRIVLSDGATGNGLLQLRESNGPLIGAGPSGGVDQSNPGFSPTGTRLVWDARSSAGQNDRQLYVSDVVAGNAQPTGVVLAPTTIGENYQASWGE